MTLSTGPRTALVVEVPEADPVVGDLRRVHDPVTAHGMPAHVTILYPFRRVETVTSDVLAELLDVVGDFRPFTTGFTRVATFPANVVYLEPDHPEPFVALTDALLRTFPDCPPYEGRFDVVIPHLTVGESTDEAVYADLQESARQAVAATPISTDVGAVALYSRDDAGRWVRRAQIPLGTDASLR